MSPVPRLCLAIWALRPVRRVRRACRCRPRRMLLRAHWWRSLGCVGKARRPRRSRWPVRSLYSMRLVPRERPSACPLARRGMLEMRTSARDFLARVLDQRQRQPLFRAFGGRDRANRHLYVRLERNALQAAVAFRGCRQLVHNRDAQSFFDKTSRNIHEAHVNRRRVVDYTSLEGVLHKMADLAAGAGVDQWNAAQIGRRDEVELGQGAVDVTGADHVELRQRQVFQVFPRMRLYSEAEIHNTDLDIFEQVVEPDRLQR